MAVAIAAVCAGCGTATSERDAAAVVQRFQDAIGARHGAVACAQLTSATRASVASDEQRPCSEAVLSLGLDGGGRVGEAEVYLTAGMARVGDEAAFLDQTPAGWRISAAACAPTRDDMPYDCELEH